MTSAFNFEFMWLCVLGVTGSALVLAEFLNMKDNIYPFSTEGTIWQHINSPLGLFLAFLVLAEAVHFSAFDILYGNFIPIPLHHQILFYLGYHPQSHALAGPLFILAILRLLYLREFIYKPNHDNHLVNGNIFDLVGELGIMETDVGSNKIGKVKMTNPNLKGDVVECFADEIISSGTEVKISEVDCGMLKVIKKLS